MYASITQLVEYSPSKSKVVSSNLTTRLYGGNGCLGTLKEDVYDTKSHRIVNYGFP